MLCRLPAGESTGKISEGRRPRDVLLLPHGVAAAAVDADDGDAESCSGGEDYSAELDERRLMSWQCWMVESASVVVVGAEAARPAPAQPEDDGAAADGDADSDRLFWEACIAHGY